MGLLSANDRARLQRDFAGMSRPVRLLFFTQTLECETCLQTRQILDELPALSDRITIEEINFLLEQEPAERYGIDRVPAIAILGQDESRSDRDSHIRFLGIPAGYEFISLIQAILLTGGAPSQLSEPSRARIAAVDKPMTLRVFTTPTCPHCPRAVNLAQEMAFANPHITAYGIEVTEFPDLAQKYHVNGVPKTVIDDEVEILGAVPEEEFVEQATAKYSIKN